MTRNTTSAIVGLIYCLICCYTSAVAQAKAAPNETLIDTLRKYRVEESMRLSKRIDLLRDSADQALSILDRAAIELALSKLYLQRNEPQQAMARFERAELLAKVSKTLQPAVEFQRLNLAMYADQESEVERIYALLNTNPYADRKRLFETMLTYHFAKKNWLRIVSLSNSLEKNFNPRKLRQASLRAIAQAYEDLGEHARSADYLEALAEKYPLGAEASWAFEKLIAKSKAAEINKRHIFSRGFLTRLAFNKDLDISLRNTLWELSNSKIVDDKGRVLNLDTVDRYELQIAMGLFEELRMRRQEIVELSQSKTTKNAARAWLVLARLSFEEGDYAESAKCAQNAVKLSQGVKSIHQKSLESLASAQYYSQDFQGASFTYGRLSSQYGRTRYSWDHFWMTYLSGDLLKAKSVLSKRGAVSLKDPGEPAAKAYWIARIDQKQQNLNSDLGFKAVLQDNPISYYAAVTRMVRPDLFDTVVESASPSVGEDSDEIYSANHTNIVATESDYESSLVGSDAAQIKAAIRALARAGLNEDAGDLLRKVDSKSIKSDDEVTELAELARKSNDFQIYRRFPSVQFKDMFLNPFSFLSRSFSTERKAWRSAYPDAYGTIVRDVANRVDVDPNFIFALMRTESRFDRFALSVVGASGLLQLMPKTAYRVAKLLDHKSFQLSEMGDPAQNIVYGAYYYSFLLKQFAGNPIVAAAAYNAGPIAANRWLAACKGCTTDEWVESITYRETRRYVKDVLKHYGIYRKIYNNLPLDPVLPPLPASSVDKTGLF